MPTIPPPQPSSQSSPSFHLPVRGRWGGGEGPPSLGSQPLNQALSHPVNLKQSGFNSSCLSVPTLAVSVEARSSGFGQSRQAGMLRKTPQHRPTQALTSFLPSTFGFLHSCHTANSDPWCQGNFWNSTLFCFTVHCGVAWARFKLRWLLIFSHILVTVVTVIIKEPSFYATQASKYHNSRPQLSSRPDIRIDLEYLHNIKLHQCALALDVSCQIIPLPDNITLSAKQMMPK